MAFAAQEALRAFAAWPSERPEVPLGFEPSILSGETKAELLMVLMRGGIETVIEIGSWLGESSSHIVRSAPGVEELYAIDTWLGSPGVLHDERRLQCLERYQANLWEHRERVYPIRMDSVSGLKYLSEMGVEPQLIFIDGGHEYFQALADVMTADRYFSSAILVLDDYADKDVGGAVREACERTGRGLKPRAWCCRIEPKP